MICAMQCLVQQVGRGDNSDTVSECSEVDREVN